MKKIKECPLLILFLLSCLFFLFLKVTGTLEEENIHIEKISASVVGIDEKLENKEKEVLSNSVSENETEVVITENATLSENEASKVYEFTTVGEEYFADALFIGDSRTAGLMQYAKNIGQPVFYSQVGLTIHTLLSAEIVQDEEKKISVEEALTKNKFAKIYIMVGINELGRGTPQTFLEEYKKVVARIRVLQPEATIFIEAIMKVSEEKSKTDPIFNNVNITQRNEAIQTLENKQDIFFLDMNEAVVDETGNLNKDYSFDGVHLKVIYYELWEEYLKQHGIER